MRHYFRWGREDEVKKIRLLSCLNFSIKKADIHTILVYQLRASSIYGMNARKMASRLEKMGLEKKISEFFTFQPNVSLSSQIPFNMKRGYNLVKSQKAITVSESTSTFALLYQYKKNTM